MRKFLQVFVLFAVSISMAIAVLWTANVNLPSKDNPIVFYSTQTQQDLRETFLEAINQAKKSISLVIFSMRDSAVIHALNQKAKDGIEVTVVYDSKAAKNLDRLLTPKIKKVKRNPKGISHQKILIIDDARVFVGSANMTTASLRYYSNLVNGFWDKELALWIKERISQMDSFNEMKAEHRVFQINDQTVDFWFLPNNSDGPKKVIDLIRSAKKKLRIAMFTWTRLDFAKEVIKAYQRGVDVEVMIDKQSGFGASQNVIHILKDAGVPLYFNRGDELLHFKMMIIDDEILVNGSANWTKSAFLRNDDCFFVLKALTNKQKYYLDYLWDVVKSEAYREKRV